MSDEGWLGLMVLAVMAVVVVPIAIGELIDRWRDRRRRRRDI